MPVTSNSYSPEFELVLFGSFQIRDRGQNVLKLRSNSERALLTFLAVESGQPHSREYLGDLIWEDLDQDRLANNLRVTLSRLRKALQLKDGKTPLITTTGQMVSLKTEYLWIDVAEFSDLIEQSIHHEHPADEDCPECLSRVQRAAEIFGGEFLQGLTLTDSLPFQEWVVIQREKLHRYAINAFKMLADHYLRRGVIDQAQIFAWRQLELEPWREEAHRQLMRIFVIDGQKTAALAQYERCTEILEHELGAEPSSDTQELYRRIKRSRSRKRPALPPATSVFVGRQQEQANIIQMLSRSDCRLMTITGMGGVGKTRLAAKIASQMEHAFLDGAVFVSLASLQTSKRIPDVLADNLGFSFGGKREPIQQLAGYLEEKEYLLVLDNFEHLLDGAEYLDQIWQRCPGVKILTTSRERLGLPYECLIEIQGLPVADGPEVESSAADLLLTCIHKYAPEFDPDELTRKDITDLARNVGGMPLALELIAPMIRVYSVRELLDNFDQLEKSSLGPVFERSWVLLSDEERTGVMKLSVFRTPFTRADALMVGGVDAGMLTGYVDKTLLRRLNLSEQDRYDRSEAVFDFHPLLKQYLQDKLAASPEVWENTLEAHASCFLEFLVEKHKVLYLPEELLAIKSVFPHFEDVLAAMVWGAGNQRYTQVRKGLRFFIHYFESLGAFRQGEVLFGAVVKTLQDVRSEHEGEAEHLDPVLARALWFYGWHQMRIGQEDLALETYNQGLSLARASSAVEEEAGILNAIGLIYRYRDMERSNQYLEQAIEAGYRAENQWHIASFYSNLGINAMVAAKYDLAAEYLDTGKKMMEELGHFWGIIGNYHLLGQLKMLMDHDQEAEEYLNQALALTEQYDYRWMRIKTLVSLGNLAFKREDWREAVEYYQQSFEEIDTFGNTHLLEETEEKFQIALQAVESRPSEDITEK